MIRIDLSQKSVLITGSLGAIAEHIVRELSEAGAFLVLTDAKSDTDAVRIIESWRIPVSRYIYRQMDVTDPYAVGTVIDEMMSGFPNLDTVLGHAGGCGPPDLHFVLRGSDSSYPNTGLCDRKGCSGALYPLPGSRACVRWNTRQCDRSR